MKPADRFSDRVADYVRYRPRYPDGVIDVLAREMELTPEWVIADIGSGTGFSAEVFLDHGNTVIGVEPNRAMREAAEGLLSDWPRFRSVAGTGEATTLDSGSIDMVVVAQAFHWLDRSAARREFMRILRPGGMCAVLWNTRRTDDNAFLRAYEQLLISHGTDYAAVRHDRIEKSELETFCGGPVTHRVLYNAQALDRDGLIGRILSSSYTPAEGDPRRDELRRDAERLFDEHHRNHYVQLVYDTDIYVACMRP